MTNQNFRIPKTLSRKNKGFFFSFPLFIVKGFRCYDFLYENNNRMRERKKDRREQ